MQNLFSQHIARLQGIVQHCLEIARLDGLWIYVGAAKYHFLDDQAAPFKMNPHFNYFLPYPQAEKSWLFVDGKNKPKVYFYAPNDYWHSTPKLPQEAFFFNEFDWQVLTDDQQIRTIIQPQHTAFIGEDEKLAQSLGFEAINVQKILNVLHFERSIKSEFEVACIYQAQFSALRGHEKAKQAFFDGKSEFEINLAYLQASQQSENHVPYGNIVAINQHSAILHYTHLDSTPPLEKRSFLLDAGSTFMGYASDLTRTYAVEREPEFAELIAQISRFKDQTISDLAVGINYLHYHSQMHRWMSQLLHEFGFVTLSAEQIFDEGISRAFFPHGLGHQLGLQVHDVAGFQQNARGTRKAAPDIYPSLRCTRDLAEGMVLTIEPGFYFIETLLAQWQAHPLSRFFDWQKIARFKPLGGIRVEDNVVIRTSGAENLTQKALAQGI